MKTFFLACAGVFGALSIALGAFGAHALKARLAAHMLVTYQTAVQYQMIHTLALLATAILMYKNQSTFLTAAGILFITGTLLFSGSLYVLATTAIRWVGPLTPIGGLLLILGWLCIAIAAFR